VQASLRTIVTLAALLLCACVGYRTPLDDLGQHTRDAALPCRPGSSTLTHAEPTVMFVLDRSASMNTTMSSSRGSQTRWQAMATALGNALPAVDNAMAVGALFFPTPSGGNRNCTVASTPDLMPAVGNVNALVRLMAASATSGATPTASAIDIAAKALTSLRTATAARALVLATDGAPNCNSSLDALTCRCTSGTAGRACSSSVECLDDARTDQVIARYQAQGLPTYVIGIQSQGDTQFVDVLNAMAVAGGRPRVGTDVSYYAASSETELDAAFTTIRDQVGACTFLASSVPDPNGSIVVNLDGVDLASEAWSWSNVSNGELVLTGDACVAAAAERAPTLTAVVQCNDG
jgi:hypothetical protein